MSKRIVKWQIGTGSMATQLFASYLTSGLRCSAC
jgi:hypothetical protein